MPHVSHHALKQKMLDDISDQFINAIVGFNRKSARKFFNTFFTKTERIMFAKRLAVMFLLEEGVSLYRIARLLNVSASTVHRIRKQCVGTEQKVIMKALRRLAADGGLLDELRALLLEGFSRDPRKRSKWLREFDARYEK